MWEIGARVFPFRQESLKVKPLLDRDEWLKLAAWRGSCGLTSTLLQLPAGGEL